MAKGMKVVLPGLGYDAATDPNPAHFSVFVDGTEDHVMVKEKSRGVQSVPSSSTAVVPHDLGYFPVSMVCVEDGGGEFQWSYNAFGGAFNPFYHYVTEDDLILGNEDGSSKSFSHFIFHDRL